MGLGLGAGLIVVALFIGAYYSQSSIQSSNGPTSNTKVYQLGNQPINGVPDVPRKAPSFILTNQNGQKVSMSDFRGKTVVVSFIYTDCKGVCPRLVGKLKNVRELLPGDVQENVVFLSIDFDLNDKPEKLKRYAKEHEVGDNWHILTGDMRTIDAVMSGYGSWAEKMEGGSFDHSVVVAVVDKHGYIRKEFRGAVFYKNERIANKISEVTKKEWK